MSLLARVCFFLERSGERFSLAVELSRFSHPVAVCFTSWGGARLNLRYRPLHADLIVSLGEMAPGDSLPGCEAGTVYNERVTYASFVIRGILLILQHGRLKNIRLCHKIIDTELDVENTIDEQIRF